MQGKPTEEFLQYVQDELHGPISRTFYHESRRLPELDFESAWAEILLSIWNKAKTADDFEHFVHLHKWCCVVTTTQLKFQRIGRMNRGRSKINSFQVSNTINITDLEVYQVEQLMESRFPLEQPSQHDQMGLSQGWLKEAIESLTKKQRDAFLTMTLCNLTYKEYGEEVGRTPQTIHINVQSAKRKIREKAPEEWRIKYG